MAPFYVNRYYDTLFEVIKLERCSLHNAGKVSPNTASFELWRLWRGRTTRHFFSAFAVDLDVATRIVSTVIILDLILLCSIHSQAKLYGLVHELSNCALVCFAQFSIDVNLDQSSTLIVLLVVKLEYLGVLLDICQRELSLIDELQCS